ncbi:MAG: hypothetical protein PHS44_01225 [Candidatus Dojkabacteria bacterium]|nr:hypothetical protein [Candidatus Dojkabacteria bacterium]
MKNLSWLKAGLIAAGVAVMMQILNFASNFVVCIACISLPITCIGWLVIPLGAGFLSATWSKLEKDDFVEALKQGALAGLVLGIIVGTVSLIMNVLLSTLRITALETADFLTNEDPTGLLGNYMSFSFGLPFQVICCGGVIVMDMILSALGGIIKVALSKNSNK